MEETDHSDSPAPAPASSEVAFPGAVPNSPSSMVTAKSSNERPYGTRPATTQPSRDQMYWPTCSNGAHDDDHPPPAVPPKDLQYSPVFLSPVSTSFPPNIPPRPRYTSLSVYEPQSASMTFPEPQPHRLSTRRSIFGLTSPIRHRASKSDIGLSASTESLWRPNSNRGSYAATVWYPLRFTQASLDSTLG